MYTHQTLDLQASQQGVRQFELDVWWDVRGSLRVYHNSTTPEQHARHSRIARYVAGMVQRESYASPLFIWVEPKDWPEQAADVTTTLEISGSWETLSRKYRISGP